MELHKDKLLQLSAESAGKGLKRWRDRAPWGMSRLPGTAVRSPSLDGRARSLRTACAQSPMLFFLSCEKLVPCTSPFLVSPKFSRTLLPCYWLQAHGKQLGFLLLCEERTFRRHGCFLWAGKPWTMSEIRDFFCLLPLEMLTSKGFSFKELRVVI